MLSGGVKAVGSVERAGLWTGERRRSMKMRREARKREGERERLTGNLHLGSALEKGVGESQVEKNTHSSRPRDGEKE